MRFYIFFVFPLPFRSVPTLPCVPEWVTLSNRPLGTAPFFRISLWYLAGQGPSDDVPSCHPSTKVLMCNLVYYQTH